MLHVIILKGPTGQIRLARESGIISKPMVSTSLAIDFNIFFSLSLIFK